MPNGIRWPSSTTAIRRKDDGRLYGYVSGRWRRLADDFPACEICGATFAYVANKHLGKTCGAACRNAATAALNAARTGERNPHWKGGVSTDNMRYRRRQAEKWPERDRARKAVTAAVRGGRLTPEPCEKCGEPKAQAHHDDYSKPLAVRWLCVAHHREHHRGHATGRVEREAARPASSEAA